MKKTAYKVIALIFLIMVLAPLVTINSGGDTVGLEGGKVECSTNLQLIPQAKTVGGGNIHWTIEGEAAQQLRSYLLASVGNDELFPNIANGDDTLDQAELELYLNTNGMLESYIQRGGALNGFRGKVNINGFEPRRDIEPDEYIEYFGGPPITRSSLNSDDIAGDTKGLLGYSSEDTSPINIHFTISFREQTPGRLRQVDMSDLRLLNAIWESMIIPVRQDLITDAGADPQTEFVIEQDNLLTNATGSYGIVLRNGLREPEGDNYTISRVETGLEVNIEDDSIREGDNFTVVYAHTLKWEGRTEFTHWSYVVGTNSFYDPVYDDGTLYLIRTPAGEILYYSIDVSGGNVPEATIMFEEFNILENPQLLFLIVSVFAYFIRYFPKKYFKDYKEMFPQKNYKKAEKCRPVHLLSGIATAFIFVIYFFPTLGGFFVNGLFLIIIGGVLTALFGVLSQFIYSMKKKNIPEESLATMSTTRPRTRKKTVRRKTTRRTVAPKKTSKKGSKIKRTYCDWCGEFFTVHKERNLLTVDCPSCSKRQHMLKEGYNYLFLDPNGNNSFSLLIEFIKEGLPVLVITTKMPSKLEEKYGLHRAKIMWVSDQVNSKNDVLNPKRLDFEITRAITNFSKENERAVIFVDGFEYLLVENGFEKVSKFIKKTTDTCSLNASTYMIYVNPNSISKQELSILKKEFDNIEDLRDPKEKNN